MSLVITHSDMKAFLTCRRAWYWSYVQDFRPPDKLVGPLALGTRVHSAIEHYYKTGGDPAVEHARLAEKDAAVVEATGKPWELDQIWEDITVGRNCVSAHQDWLAETGADDKYEVHSVEQTLEAPILDGQVLLRGKIDTLFRDTNNGFLSVNDLKTDGDWRGTTQDDLARSWQHTFYGVLVTQSMPDEIFGEALYTVMRKVKRPERATKPLVERFHVPGIRRAAAARLSQIETICTDMLSVMDAVETHGSRHVYPTPGDACRWCAFKHPCSVFDDSPTGARALLDDQFERGSRHARYKASDDE